MHFCFNSFTLLFVHVFNFCFMFIHISLFKPIYLFFVFCLCIFRLPNCHLFIYCSLIDFQRLLLFLFFMYLLFFQLLIFLDYSFACCLFFSHFLLSLFFVLLNIHFFVFWILFSPMNLFVLNLFYCLGIFCLFNRIFICHVCSFFDFGFCFLNSVFLALFFRVSLIICLKDFFFLIYVFFFLLRFSFFYLHMCLVVSTFCGLIFFTCATIEIFIVSSLFFIFCMFCNFLIHSFIVCVFGVFMCSFICLFIDFLSFDVFVFLELSLFFCIVCCLFVFICVFI